MIDCNMLTKNRTGSGSERCGTQLMKLAESRLALPENQWQIDPGGLQLEKHAGDHRPNRIIADEGVSHGDG